MKYFEFEFADWILLAVSPIVNDRWWFFKSKAERRPLRARNADPRGLFRQRSIHELVALVQVNFGRRLKFLERCDAADVVEVRVSKRDALERETASLERLNNPFCFVARIDADRLLCLFTTDDAGMLLKRGDGDFLDNHLLV